MTDPGVTWDDRGLAPGIVQDADTGRVLMLGYLNRAALDATLDTGEVHFWSRSRNELWHKGATSGATLAVREIRTDCDGDAVLIRVVPAGPTCHTGAATCFDAAPATRPTPAPAQGFASLEALWATIRRRADDRPDGSYTARLLEGGVDLATRKVLEEAGEVLLAAKDHAAGAEPKARIAEEAADLLYHLLVLLAERGMEPSDVLRVLAARAGGRS